MNNELSAWFTNELLPAAFQNIDRLLPEMNFTRKGRDWISAKNIDGSNPKTRRNDKTVIREQRPGILYENGHGDKKGIVSYIAERDGITNWEAQKKIAEICSVQIPNSNYTSEANNYYRRQDILTAATDYWQFCLFNSNAGQQVVEYLKDTRGYTDEGIHERNQRGLGANPGKQKTHEYLLYKGYTQDEIDEHLPNCSDLHILTIAYWAAGKINGVKFRAIDPAIPKAKRFLSLTGTTKELLYNLPGLKNATDIVIVEGELDAISADIALTPAGKYRAVATTQTIITNEQIQSALQRGVKSFTICLDLDEDGEGKRAKAIDRVLNVLFENNVYTVYIALLNSDKISGKVDPDNYILTHGEAAFCEIIDNALTWYMYKLHFVLGKLPNETDRDIQTLQQEIVKLGALLQDPIDRNNYQQAAAQYLQATPEALAEATRQLEYKANEERQRAELRKLQQQIGKALDAADVPAAIANTEKRIAEIRALNKGAAIETPKTYAQIIAGLATVPQTLRTGYPILDEFIGIQPAAITLVTARPSHGKTTFLLNLALNFCENYPQLQVVFFTYEEPRTAIYLKLLNCLLNRPLERVILDREGLTRLTNTEFLKAYLKKGRTDIPIIEEAQRALQILTDSGRLTVHEKNYTVEELEAILAPDKVKDVGAVFIDYIQRMKTAEIPFQEKRLEVAYISDRVLQIAKNTGLPIVLGAQAKRSDKQHVRLEDLKEAGNLEEDANTVISLYNHWRGNSENDDEEQDVPAITKLTIKALKNRDGEVNRKADLSLNQHTGRVSDDVKDRRPVKTL